MKWQTRGALSRIKRDCARGRCFYAGADGENANVFGANW